MNPRQHALLARELIAACGGVEEAADNCRVDRTQLYAYRDPNRAAFMPADVMADLEAYCGQPVYSRVLCEARPASNEVAGVVTEACEMNEAAGELQRLVRLAAADGELSERERLEIEAGLNRLEEQARQLRAATERGRA